MKRGYSRFFRDGSTFTFIDISKTQHYPHRNMTCYSDCWSYDADGPRDLRLSYPVIDLQFNNALTGKFVGEEITYKDVPSSVKRAYTRWEKLQ